MKRRVTVSTNQIKKTNTSGSVVIATFFLVGRRYNLGLKSELQQSRMQHQGRHRLKVNLYFELEFREWLDAVIVSYGTTP